MVLRAVIAGGAEAAGLDPAALDRLQWEQFQHDEKYHREIARLTVQDRLKHMALHFAKYAGNLAEAAGDNLRVQRIVTDIFIIATSTANVLNMRLSDRLEGIAGCEGPDSLLLDVTVAAGRMAAACEKMDHLEDFPFRKTITEAVLQLAANALSYCELRGWRIEELVSTRLQPVKEKSIFYHRLSEL